MVQDWAPLLFTYGPFALLLLFVFVIERRARQLLHSSMRKPVGVVVYALNWVTIFLLCFVVVVVWIRLNVPEQESTIRGRLIGLTANDILSSPFEEMYLRRVYGASARSDFVWRIITRRPLRAGAVIPLYVDRSAPGRDDVQIFELRIEPAFYDGEVSLLYESAQRRLSITEPTAQAGALKEVSGTISSSSVSDARFWFGSFIATLFAQARGSLADISTRLQADDPVIRLQARSDLAGSGAAALNYIDEVLSDTSSSYRLRLGVIVALNKMGSGTDRLSTRAYCAIVASSRDRDVLLQEQSAKYLATHSVANRSASCSPSAVRTSNSETPSTAKDLTRTIGDGERLWLMRGNALFKVDLASKAEARVLQVPRYFSYPGISADERRVVFYRRDDKNVASYFVFDSMTRREIPFPLGPVDGNRFAVSNDGSLVSFTGYPKGKSTFATDIYVVGVDGTGLRRLTNASEDHAFRDSGWSPDGKQLVAIETFNAPLTAANVVIIDVSSGQVRRLFEFKRESSAFSWIPTEPTWSQAATLIAFLQGQTVNFSAPDGTGLRSVQVPNEYEVRFAPLVWSPDGTRIAFSASYQKKTVALALTLSTNQLDILGSGNIVAWHNPAQ
jgi:hypothetical protein